MIESRYMFHHLVFRDIKEVFRAIFIFLRSIVSTVQRCRNLTFRYRNIRLFQIDHFYLSCGKRPHWSQHWAPSYLFGLCSRSQNRKRLIKLKFDQFLDHFYVFFLKPIMAVLNLMLSIKKGRN